MHERIILSPSGEYLVSISSHANTRIIIHSARTGEIIKVFKAYSEYAVTKVAFNPSETVLYFLTWDHDNPTANADDEALCQYTLTTEETKCVLFQNTLSSINDQYYMKKSHGSELVVFDDYIVVSRVVDKDYYDSSNKN